MLAVTTGNVLPLSSLWLMGRRRTTTWIPDCSAMVVSAVAALRWIDDLVLSTRAGGEDDTIDERPHRVRSASSFDVVASEVSLLVPLLKRAVSCAECFANMGLFFSDC